MTEKTGWPAGLMQNDDKKLSQWFASRLDARRVVREVCAAIRAEYTARLKELKRKGESA